MKKLKHAGAALLYIAIYFALQTVVVSIYGFFAVAGEIYKTMLVRDVDFSEIADIINKSVRENAVLLTVITNILFVLTVFIIFKVRKKNFFREVGFLRPDPKFILPVMALGASLNVIISVVFSAIPFPESWWDAYNQASVSMDEMNALTVVAAVVIGPLTEEILFRGLLFTRVSRGFGVTVGIFASALVFAVLHGTIIWGLYTFLFGLLLAFVFVRSRSIVFPILLHFSFNLAGVLLSDGIPLVFIVISFIVFVAAAADFIIVSGKNRLRPADAPDNTDGEEKKDE